MNHSVNLPPHVIKEKFGYKDTINKCYISDIDDYCKNYWENPKLFLNKIAFKSADKERLRPADVAKIIKRAKAENTEEEKPIILPPHVFPCYRYFRCSATNLPIKVNAIEKYCVDFWENPPEFMRKIAPEWDISRYIHINGTWIILPDHIKKENRNFKDVKTNEKITNEAIKKICSDFWSQYKHVKPKRDFKKSYAKRRAKENHKAEKRIFSNFIVKESSIKLIRENKPDDWKFQEAVIRDTNPRGLDPGYKYCTICKNIKPFEEFSIGKCKDYSGKNILYRFTICKACNARDNEERIASGFMTGWMMKKIIKEQTSEIERLKELLTKAKIEF